MNVKKIREAIEFERQHQCEYADTLCDFVEYYLEMMRLMQQLKEKDAEIERLNG